MGLDRARLRELIRERSLTPRALSLAVGDNPYLVRDILSEKSRNPRSDTVAKLAEQLSTTVADLVTEGGDPSPRAEPTLTLLPIVGRIQAGAWLEVDDFGQDEPEPYPVALDRRYPHAPQWLREVQGESMNARGVYPGDLAHIVDFVQAGIALTTGQIVEVTRYRDGGALREVTLKEVELVQEGVLLWPRSTNPQWKDPVRLDDGSGQDIEVQVTGLLLAAIRRF